ncbi:NAD-dependent protein deacylase [Thermoanaerobacterium sp. RBIITD]|uniref:SIR2 family NAD-dependent protein deacylase n=1 Tax=Thermoanaerobacterium sp. RBIITD TaxID=1550240 RepID=UPI000BB6A803|nr:NAD-dependent protein deacylase [Thermoanaerobacterium sp. RBIITD]SNX54985.1 NAD-dependent deacetylase [Thermoanaerobacterium sp. RBIITD]
MNVDTNVYEKAAELIKKSKKTIVLTGAGISTESGIPDFRSPGTGLWEKMDPMEALSTRVLYNDPIKFYNNGFKILLSMKDARPNKAHYILAQMEDEGLISGIITQNIDNLHQKAGSHRIFEVHGQTRTGSCMNCGTKVSIDVLNDKIEKREIPPICDKCNGILRPDVVMFGDPMPEDFEKAWHEASNSDLMIVIGSSLTVSPVNFLPGLVKHLIIINKTRTPEDNRADVVIRCSASEALSNIITYLNKEEK